MAKKKKTTAPAPKPPVSIPLAEDLGGKMLVQALKWLIGETAFQHSGGPEDVEYSFFGDEADNGEWSGKPTPWGDPSDYDWKFTDRMAAELRAAGSPHAIALLVRALIAARNTGEARNNHLWSERWAKEAELKDEIKTLRAQIRELKPKRKKGGK